MILLINTAVVVALLGVWIRSMREAPASASRRRGPLPAHVCGLQAVMTSFPWDREELPGGPWPRLSLCPWHWQAFGGGAERAWRPATKGEWCRVARR